MSKARSLAEEALGEGGDEAQFDQEAKNRLGGGEHGQRIVERETAGKEAPPMERGHAEDKRAQRREGQGIGLAEEEVRRRPAEDDREIDDDAASRLVAVASQSIEEEREEVRSQPQPPQNHAALQDLRTVGEARGLLVEPLRA